MLDVKLTNVFYRTSVAFLNAINGTGARLIINVGGQGSSKTFSVLQLIYYFLHNSNQRYKVTFCSYALPHLKQGVISDFDSIIDSFGGNIGKIKTSPQQPVYNIGRSEINCYGIEGNMAMAHGPRRDILYINEANRKVSYEVFDQLFSRSKITFIDFNPDQEFWLHEKVIPNFPHVIINSNFMDNPYLPEQERNNILMKKDKKGFENWWRVYGLGEMGRSEGVVIKDWRFEQSGEVYEKLSELSYFFVMDFGFNPDPDTLLKMAIDQKRRKIYVKECFYENGLGINELSNKIGYYVSGRENIIADSASPRMIHDLSLKYNIQGVVKGAGSIAEGLKILDDFEIIISEDSKNLAKELTQYIWSDRKAGIPIDAFNHCIDPIRYGAMTHTNLRSFTRLIK